MKVDFKTRTELKEAERVAKVDDTFDKIKKYQFDFNGNPVKWDSSYNY